MAKGVELAVMNSVMLRVYLVLACYATEHDFHFGKKNQ